MKTQLKEYGTISVRWIDEEIKRLEKERDLHDDSELYAFYDGRACQLEHIKKQLLINQNNKDL